MSANGGGGREGAAVVRRSRWGQGSGRSMRRTWEKKSGWEASRGEGVEGACGWLEGERFTLTEWRRAQGSAPNCVRGGVPFGVPNTQGGGPSIRHGMSAS